MLTNNIPTFPKFQTKYNVANVSHAEVSNVLKHNNLHPIANHSYTIATR